MKGTGAGRYSTAFFAMTGICVIGLYISYAIPIYLRLTNPDFQTGPWNLKGHHKLVGWTALVWIGFITILFFAPLFWPFWRPWGADNMFFDDGEGNTFYKLNNFNFTGPLIILSALAILCVYWHFSGKKWFTGPKVQGTPEELLAIERELDAARARHAADRRRADLIVQVAARDASRPSGRLVRVTRPGHGTASATQGRHRCRRARPSRHPQPRRLAAGHRHLARPRRRRAARRAPRCGQEDAQPRPRSAAARCRSSSRASAGPG